MNALFDDPIDRRTLRRRGYDAKMAAIGSDQCPVARERRGTGEAHDLLSCEWCKGWASAELRLYQIALDARRDGKS